MFLSRLPATTTDFGCAALLVGPFAGMDTGPPATVRRILICSFLHTVYRPTESSLMAVCLCTLVHRGGIAEGTPKGHRDRFQDENLTKYFISTRNLELFRYSQFASEAVNKQWILGVRSGEGPISPKRWSRNGVFCFVFNPSIWCLENSKDNLRDTNEYR